MYKLPSVLIIALFILFFAGAISFAASPVEQSPEMYDPNIRAKMELHMKKAKRKNPAKYEMMLERAGNNITGCLSCHSDLIEQQDSNRKNTP
jgi:hypothetical protein